MDSCVCAVFDAQNPRHTGEELSQPLYPHNKLEKVITTPDKVLTPTDLQIEVMPDCPKIVMRLTELLKTVAEPDSDSEELLILLMRLCVDKSYWVG